jgi:hypothetical protein
VIWAKPTNASARLNLLKACFMKFSGDCYR